ncbi:MAG: Fic family protein [Anaerolineales bacterium]|nr:Fic family protein [Anaerolineales bacterium]
MPYRFEFTPTIVRYLQAIERVRETVRLTVLPPLVAERLRLQSQVRCTHYSTRIEGNRLTLKETGLVLQQGRRFPGWERDVKEVQRYYQALQLMEQWVAQELPLTAARLQKLHALLYSGRKAGPSPYRDGQNVIRDGDGQIVYLPPEAADVPGLMAELFHWTQRMATELPVPVVAGVAHYQFETIHPFFDGNGRTGRLLTTWILYQGGYDLGKFYALEEFYAQDLASYYQALATHPHHNYYFGRHEAEMTAWLEYFLQGMALVFERVAEEIRTDLTQTGADQETLALLRPLDHRARRVLALFATQQFIQSSQVASLLGISLRQSRDLLAGWVADGWLEIADPSRRGRKYSLAASHRVLLGA